MELLINGLITKIKGIFIKGSTDKEEIEGYILQKDTLRKETLLLVKEGDKCWKSHWFNDELYTYRAPLEHLATIFK